MDLVHHLPLFAIALPFARTVCRWRTIIHGDDHHLVEDLAECHRH